MPSIVIYIAVVLHLFHLNRRNCSNATAALFCEEQESPADARVMRDSAVIPRSPPATILDFIEPKSAIIDPPTPKT